MRREPLYYEGYIAGYRDGVKDAVTGNVTDWKTADIRKMPVRAMALSTRAYNCLMHSGCTYVEDVIALSSCSIMTMRNLGSKTASEIAHWLAEHGIACSAWTEYL